MGRTIRQDGTAIRVIADQSHRLQRKGGAEAREVLEDIVGGTTIGGGFSEDVRQRVLLAPNKHRA